MIFQKYETTDDTLRKEFGRYGEILQIFNPKPVKGRPRGSSFIEFARRSDMLGKLLFIHHILTTLTFQKLTRLLMESKLMEERSMWILNVDEMQ